MILTVFSHKKVPSAAIARYALAEFLRLNGREIYDAEYLHRADGSPYFDRENAPYISVSHSADYVAAAISYSPVGIDIQAHTEIDYDKIAERFGMKVNSKEDFFDAFSAAEAKTKALRVPLAESLRSPEGKIFHFIPRFTLAIYGEGEIFFTFCFEG